MFVFVFVVGLAGTSQAWQLTLTGQHLVWNPAAPSPTHVVGIENLESSTDPLFAWSLGLQIVPDPTATGTVQFASTTIPGDYLLAGRSGGLVPAFAGPATSISPMGDSDDLFEGVVVPETGKNLLATTFVASPDALGLFYIFAVPDPFAGANWFSDDFQNAQAFANVPFTGGPVLIGSINVVPEPSALLLIGQMSLALALFSWRCRRRN